MTVEIPLTRGLVALVDDEDAEWLGQFRWCAMPKRNAYYAMRSVYGEGRSKTTYMHRLIAAPPPGMHVDHINLNSLDNRRENLRICRVADNIRNRGALLLSRTGVKGVSPKRDKFIAQIQVNGRSIHLGTFLSTEEAHAAYCEAARRLHGEFARFE